jgi:FdhD protein
VNHPGQKSFTILRFTSASSPSSELDQLAVEEPLEIRIDTRPINVTMRTPAHDHELALGFLLSEGLVRAAVDILKVAPNPDASNVIDVFLAPGVSVDYARLTRHVLASSSCGLCGKAAMDALYQQFPAVESQVKVSSATLLSLPVAIQKAQDTFNRTGGLHAAAVFDLSGNLIVLREDIGRHNAVDKILGYGLAQNLLPFDSHILVVSGRASFEIMQKALAGRIPIVAAVSAPSSLAVDFALASSQTLVGFLRDGRMNVYAGAERIQFGDI